MSFTPFKEITINNPGTSIKYGGDDTKEIMKIFNGVVVANRRPQILNPWIWLDNFDIKAPGTAPAAPTDTNTNRIYTDPTDFKLKIRKTGGTIVDVENVNIPNSALTQITDKAKLHSSIMYENEDNNAGDHFMDFGDIAVPANPAAGTIRLFNDTATGKLSVRKSGGTTVSLEEAGGGGGTLDSLSDVVITSPASPHFVAYNGTNWVNRLIAKADLPTVTPFEDESNTFTSSQKFDSFLEQKTQSIPTDPAATYIRVYPKAVDANNDGWFAKVKENSAIVEVRIF